MVGGGIMVMDKGNINADINRAVELHGGLVNA